MPKRPPRLCPTCKQLVNEPRCPRCTREPYARSKPRTREHPSRVNARAWRRLRLSVFEQQHFICAAADCTSLTTELDHIVSIEAGGGDERSNLQGLCTPCHDEKTQAEARRAAHQNP